MIRGPKPTAQPLKRVYRPKPPPDLDGDAKEEWIRVTGILAKKRVLDHEDTAALYVYVTSFAEYKESQRKLRDEGYTVVTDRGVVKSPWVTIGTQAFLKMKSLLAEFGLTPTARARLKPAEPQTPDDPDDF